MKQSWFWFVILYTTLVFSMTSEPALGLTDSADVSALQSFLKGIKNADVLKWSGDDPCGGRWKYVKCIGNSVVAIEAGSGNLQGTVAPEINNMKHLMSLQLQDNKFTGSLPSLSGLSWLTEAYFGGNSFDTIPADFFVGLANLTSLYLENNQLNGTGGWTLPDDLAQCSQLTALSLTNTNLYGGIPDYLGNMTSLQKLYLAYNHLQGGIPSSFAGSRLVVFQANNQQGPLLSGSIHAVGSMQNLEKLWLQVNEFSGTIPPGLGNVAGLQDLKLNDNQFVGTIPESLTSLLALQNISVKNNHLVGAIPGFRTSVNLEYDGNKFCNDVPGVPCSPDVSALLTFIGTANGYTSPCVSNWENGDPCKGGWSGVICQPGTNNVSVLNLPKCQLNGKISSAIANLSSLTTLKLQNNGLRGTIPIELTQMPSLITIDLSYNNLTGPFPTFPASVKVNLQGNQAAAGPSPSAGSGGGNTGTAGQPSSFSNSSNGPGAAPESSGSVHVGAIVGPIVAVVAVAMAGIAVYYYCRKKRQGFLRVPSSRTTVVVHPRDSGSDREAAKTVPLVNLNVANNGRNSGPSEVHVDTGNLAISIQVLRKATNGFSEDSILGRGGFGVVYKGQLEDGTLIAVKRMQASAVTNKALTEFQAEIGVLTKVRHRHLVALLGYCVEAGERLLVYEYMPQGTLCQHLFEYEKYNYKPLSWKQRLVVALDVARGLEYLHGLAHKSFIHRDLKPSNILLGDDLRAKVSDFGLVKLAPEGKFSIETRVAGTFGYLAPEYAVTGRVTTKVDVYSFGVVLMELITGRRALDDTQPEENMHLVTWFRRMVNNRETFMASLDKNIEITDETFQSISTVAQLAGHCTHREPHQRPDMSHAVNVLGPMVERWKPSVDFDAEGSAGIDLGLSLPEALRRWQEVECTATIDDTQSSIPPRSAEPGQMDLLR